jgi:hypothetical protein
VSLVKTLATTILRPQIIVLGSAEQDWTVARAAFRAGAIDFLPHTMSDDEIRKLFLDVLMNYVNEELLH